MKMVNKLIMNKKVINTKGHIDNLTYNLEANDMLVVNLYSDDLNSFDINIRQKEKSHLVINLSGYVKRNIKINLKSDIIGNNNTCIFNVRVIGQDDHADIIANVKALENTQNNKITEDLKAILEQGTINFLPILEIDTSEVEANHYATIGFYNKDELFYLQTKGISEKEGIDILKRSFLYSHFSKEFMMTIKRKDENE